MNTVNITVQGIGLIVTGQYIPEEPRTWENPGLSADFEIETVKLADPDADIWDILTTAIDPADIAIAAVEAYEEAHGGDEDEQWEAYCEAREEQRKLQLP